MRERRRGIGGWGRGGGRERRDRMREGRVVKEEQGRREKGGLGKRRKEEGLGIERKERIKKGWGR